MRLKSDLGVIVNPFKVSLVILAFVQIVGASGALGNSHCGSAFEPGSKDGAMEVEVFVTEPVRFEPVIDRVYIKFMASDLVSETTKTHVRLQLAEMSITRPIQIWDLLTAASRETFKNESERLLFRKSVEPAIKEFFRAEFEADVSFILTGESRSFSEAGIDQTTLDELLDKLFEAERVFASAQLGEPYGIIVQNSKSGESSLRVGQMLERFRTMGYQKPASELTTQGLGSFIQDYLDLFGPKVKQRRFNWKERADFLRGVVKESAAPMSPHHH